MNTEKHHMYDRQPGQFTVADALNMYRRLRQRGQSSVLARLSVEGRCPDLTPEQRSRLRQLLQAYESQAA
jgi:hypothetical protein